jgi:hypothetical protein
VGFGLQALKRAVASNPVILFLNWTATQIAGEKCRDQTWHKTMSHHIASYDII